MKGKRFLAPFLAIAMGSVCLFTAACEELDNTPDADHGDEHTGWAYVTTDDDYHWQYATCHPDVTTEKEEHDYTDDNDATCNTCGHERHVHTGWAYVTTDPDKHWESPTCHPEVKRNEAEHKYDNEQDTTCDCGHVREIGGAGHVHTGWAYVTTDPDKHWESPSCHTDVKRNEGEHDYTDDNDATCNTCGHERHVHTGWAYVTTDDTNHWESPSCHPDVKRNEGEHVYSNDQDADCNTCGHVRTVAPPTVADEISYAHAGYESAAFEWGDSNAKNATVKYKLSSSSSYTSVDTELIRQKNSSTARVDVLGLKKNTVYDFEIKTSANKTLTVTNVLISGYDREGSYAHFNYTSGVGAYNDDGTLKSNAVVVYVTEATKNTVTAKVNGSNRTGLVNILKNAGTSTPLVVRIIGTVGAATWKKLVENNDKALTPDKVLGMDGKTKLVDKYNIDRSTKGSDGKYTGGTSKDITQATLIADGINELDTKNDTLLELKNLNSKMKYDASKDEFDSCWNDCNIENVKNVTIEGVGEDAKIFQWGFTFKNSSSIEVRNLTFDDYTEDACSFEGSQTSASSLSDFKSGNIWVHNNTFEEGNNYWDVCNEQDKHDGDGSTDFKGLKDITISYNVYNKTHKTGLIGGGNSQTTANVTFHHNWYNGCKSRLPLARQANMHMYNNYYNATTSCAISLRAGAYALIENCYFDTVDGATSVELQTDSTYKDGAAKLVNCENKSGKFTNAGNSNHFYNGTDRAATVTNDNKFSKTFDIDSSKFYYANGQSKVGLMLAASAVPDYVKANSGVMKRSNNITDGGTTNPEPKDWTITCDNADKKTTLTIIEDGLTAVFDGTGNGDSTKQNPEDFKFGSSSVTLTLTLADLKEGQTISIKVYGFSGSNEKVDNVETGYYNAVDLTISSATNATAAPNNATDNKVTFAKCLKADNIAKEMGTFVYTVNADGTVTLVLNRALAATTRVTKLEISVV